MGSAPFPFNLFITVTSSTTAISNHQELKHSPHSENNDQQHSISASEKRLCGLQFVVLSIDPLKTTMASSIALWVTVSNPQDWHYGHLGFFSSNKWPHLYEQVKHGGICIVTPLSWLALTAWGSCCQQHINHMVATPLCITLFMGCDHDLQKVHYFVMKNTWN